MCDRCGCGQDAEPVLVNLATGEHTHADGTRHSHAHAAHDHHHHGHDHHHDHDPHETHERHGPGRGRTETVHLEQRVLAKNDALATRNRAWFAANRILALNVVSAPGAGKTALLERTITDLRAEMAISVIEGDQATTLDGERIRKAGAPAVQVNTGAGCHLEADMVARGIETLQPVAGSLVIIENVGNLVCPALFDLGERAKVALLSVTEGEDKPLKYPHMFRAARLVLINKVDLIPHLDIDLGQMIGNLRQINPDARVLQLSAKSGAGLGEWYGWLRAEAATVSATRPESGA